MKSRQVRDHIDGYRIGRVVRKRNRLRYEIRRKQFRQHTAGQLVSQSEQYEPTLSAR
jgi:hypothetical protein